MAGIRQKGEGWYCTFRFRGRRYNFALGKVTEDQARARGVEVDEVLSLVERGRLEVPDGVRLEDFVAAGGKAIVVSARPETVTARQLFDRYLETFANGTVEENTLSTRRTLSSDDYFSPSATIRNPLRRWSVRASIFHLRDP